MLSIMVFVPYINLDFETFNCYYIINSNYSEPLRTKKADASCSHVSSRFSCSQGGSNRATPTHMSKISCAAAGKHEYRAVLRMCVGWF